ncbi:ATP-dependent helicase [Phaeodactylibacter luteus]|uniref:DNA 3'-5' helicase n=1 Tax=Phaeodactylibacter luteus TaxID=1564516 RepID=A0A5C6S8Y7_9BACT|nr:UvrD-helicase domain-containing protein [Phaeodactylibacter luteus]TXB70172.1 AAA family ATPase [Phaeodactylibacter luteus]
MSNYLDGLNDVQYKAVTHTDGPVLVVAGPGSGKTRVLTYRIAHLIEKGVAPWEILALTFTNKAAREMKERIGKVVGQRANRVWAGTFHSIFARILRSEAEKIGYPSSFTIYDSDDSKSVISSIIQEMNLNKEHYNPNAVLSRISSAKSNLITPKLYEKDAELRDQDRQAKRPHIYAIYAKYTAKCKRSGAMDFDDLLYRLYELFQKNPDNVLDKYRQKFKYLLVDEFQDTNHLQYSIIRKFVQYPGSAHNICVVGDDAQSIYAFRGATIQNILDFESDFKKHDIQVFKLEQNYRSTEHIVQTANEIIGYNRRQIKKTIWSDKGEGHRIKLIKAMTDTEEGQRIADTILEQKNRYHLSNGEIAILYRTNAQSRVFEEYLRRYNIAYKIFGGLSFYQRKEVKDMVAYLRLAVNPQDEEALRRIINYPKRGIGKTTLDKIATVASQLDKPMWECLGKVQIGKRADAAIADFISMAKTFQVKAQQGDAHEVATYIAKRSGILDELKGDNSVEGMNRLENFNALLDGVKAFVEEDTVIDTENIEDKSLSSYLQNIALLTDLDTKEEENGDYVTLMSVHAAKGLEFKSVFVVGMEEKLFPSFMAMESMDGIDEERRLFYVAITRAEQFLTLSYANSRYRYGQMRYNEPSRFLQEIPLERLEEVSGSRNPTVRPGFSTSEQAGSGGAKVSGHFRKPGRPAVAPGIDPKTFKADNPADIQAGMKVLHLKFGEGKVLAVDGAASSRIATIFFKDAEDPQQRKIMLKFAKLKIIG